MRDPASYPGDLLLALRSAAALAASCGGAGPYARAARALGVDESVLRRRVLTLTEHAGGELFEGRGPSLSPTPLCRRVLAAARAVEGALASIAEERAPLRVSIGCTGAVSSELLPGALADLRRRHPSAVVRVLRAGAAAGLAGLEDGSLDLAIVRSEGPPAGVESRFIADETLWLAAPRGHPMARRRFDPARAAAHPLIAFRATSSSRARILRVLGPFGATPSIEVDGKALALRYVSLGLGIAFVSALRDRRPPPTRGVSLRDVTRHFDRTRFWIAWRKGRALTPWEERLVGKL